MNFPSGRSGVRYGLSFAYPTGASNYSLRAQVYVDDGESVFPAPGGSTLGDRRCMWSRAPMGADRERTSFTSRGLPRPC